MPTAYQKTLFVFRRDLRLEDNTGLIAALSSSKFVIPAFILDPTQLSEHPYRSTPALTFMANSLADLDQQLKMKGGRLYIFSGKPEEVVEQLIDKEKIDSVFLNQDYTPYSKERDLKILAVCKERGVAFNSFEDLLLTSPKTILKNDGSPYTIYTPFYRRAAKESIRTPSLCKGDNFYHHKVGIEAEPERLTSLRKSALNKPLLLGGRTEGLKLLKNIGTLVDYENQRNIPAFSDGTSHLSSHHKFGTVSVREVYHQVCKAFSKEHTLIRELFWRDFFTHIAWHFPFVFGTEFNKKYRSLRWLHNEKHFEAWCNGMTGFPIVDAGMRQLTATGYMHNRVRMITASFFTKDLHLNWRLGEKFFANFLIDYDPAVNNGNWQWAASTGCDAQPYFRIFNPWLQQERFDPESIYIKRWVPELSHFTPKQINNLHNTSLLTGYPRPIVDHAVEKIYAEEMFRASYK